MQALKRLQRPDTCRPPTAQREAAAAPYLDLFGWVLGARLLAMGAKAAEDDPRGAAWPGLARFYVERLLPPALGLAEVVQSTTPLDADWLAG